MAATAAWRPIGHVLVEAGAISPEDLELALVEQRQSGRRLGEVLIDSGRITWLQPANAFADQARDLEVGGETEMIAEPEVVDAVEAVERVEEISQPAPVEPTAAGPTPVEPTPVGPTVAVPAPEPAPMPAAPPVSAVVEPPASAPLPHQTEETQTRPSFDLDGDAASRLETVEAMRKERQRAFLEPVSVTERLRATVAKLQDELDERNAEIMRLRTNRTISAA